MNIGAFDAELFPLLQPFVREDYTYLVSAGNDAQRGAFITGDLVMPELTYPRITFDLLKDLYTVLGNIGDAVSCATFPTAVHRLYCAKIREYTHTRTMLRASHIGDDALFFVNSVALYGEPEEAYYAYCMRTLYHKVDAVRRHYGGDMRIAEACGRLGHMCAQYAGMEFPWDTIALPDEHVDEGIALTAYEIKALFESVIYACGLPIRVEILATCGKSTFAFDKENGVACIPSDKDLALRAKKPTETRMRALCAHEVLTHGGRGVNGLASPLQLLGVGLAGYLPGEEGVAKMLEQRVTGARFFEVQNAYLAVCFAVGMDGTPRTFRELYEVLCDTALISMMDTALYHHESVNFDVCVRRARADAWNSTLNVFRGTTGKTPGCCFTKGLVYLPGNIRVWQLLATLPTWEDKLLIGKYDPCNIDHVTALSELGIL